MKLKTKVKAGSRGYQRSQTIVRKKVRTGVKAGSRGYQHNQTIVLPRTKKGRYSVKSRDAMR